jgi:hypothetical protein
LWLAMSCLKSTSVMRVSDITASGVGRLMSGVGSAEAKRRS